MRFKLTIKLSINCLGGIISSMLACKDLWFNPARAQQLGICCISAKHLALRSKSNDWFRVMVFNATFNNISAISWHFCVRIMCLTGSTCQAGNVASVCQHRKNPAHCVGPVESLSQQHFVLTIQLNKFANSLKIVYIHVFIFLIKTGLLSSYCFELCI